MAKTTMGNDWRTEPREPRKWTFMVYMAAGDTPELDAIAVQDLREMERGGNDSAHIVVQINRAWPDSFQRYEIRKSRKDPSRRQSVLVKSDEDATDMSDQETLGDFLTWVPELFPAERYFLVLWGHAYGLGFAREHNNKLTLKELQTSLDAFREARMKMLGGRKDLKARLQGSDGRLDLLGTNACAMSYVEAAYELRKSVQYMVASQISVPFAGWPYESILRRVPDATGPADLGRLVIDLYVGHYNSLIRGERVAMSLLDLQGLEKKGSSKGLKELIEGFATEIRKEMLMKSQFGGKGRGPIRDIFIGAAAGDVRPLLDLHDLCQDFGEAESEELRKAALEVRSFLASVIVHHDQHPDLDDLNGIGIFAPFVTDPEDLQRLQLLAPLENGRSNGRSMKAEIVGQREYEQLAIFGRNAEWPRLVYDDLRQEISPELTSSIIGIDATRRQDRRNVTQIILSIDSAFNKLDRVLSTAKAEVAECLDPTKGTVPPSPRAGMRRTESENGHARRFGLPWLKLIPPLDLETELQTFRQRVELGELQRGGAVGPGDAAAIVAAVTAGKIPARYIESLVTGNEARGASPAPSVTLPNGDPDLVNKVVGFLAKVENAVGEVERAARRGLTHPSLGLGPAYPGQLGLDEPPKPGLGLDEPPKPGLGLDEPPKPGLGDRSGDDRTGGRAFGSDLRVDLALARVADLFRQVGRSLKGLEQATLEVETVARTVLVSAQDARLSPHDLAAAASEEIGRAFRILEEASSNARRTVRRVVGHPMYGIGPGVPGVGLEERQTLASDGGLDRRNLRLL